MFEKYILGYGIIQMSFVKQTPSFDNTKLIDGFLDGTKGVEDKHAKQLAAFFYAEPYRISVMRPDNRPEKCIMKCINEKKPPVENTMWSEEHFKDYLKNYNPKQIFDMMIKVSINGNENMFAACAKILRELLDSDQTKDVTIENFYRNVNLCLQNAVVHRRMYIIKCIFKDEKLNLSADKEWDNRYKFASSNEPEHVLVRLYKERDIELFQYLLDQIRPQAAFKANLKTYLESLKGDPLKDNRFLTALT